ncbi:MAG TPA: dihydropteroate synthase [Tepidisphaeraceae bacterium]|nr:dihydropteroate synthase [Tepidisphaeraceae bacterium]
MTAAEFTQWLEDPARRCLVMGILNVTPDSFSDGGKYVGQEAAVAAAHQMCEAGADILDIGGESTRPNSQRVDAEEQIRRILPVIQAIRKQLPVTISVDTTRSAVAEATLDAGAQIINDISAGEEDPEILELAAKRGAPIILMHMKGKPATMQANPAYENVVQEVKDYLRARIAAAEAVGISRGRIMVDPGIGFGKGLEHNLELLRELRGLGELGRPVVLGVSRKAFIGRITGEPEPAKRIMGTAATTAWGVANGAAVMRVHDVGPMAQVVRMVRAIQAGRMVD